MSKVVKSLRAAAWDVMWALLKVFSILIVKAREALIESEEESV